MYAHNVMHQREDAYYRKEREEERERRLRPFLCAGSLAHKLSWLDDEWRSNRLLLLLLLLFPF